MRIELEELERNGGAFAHTYEAEELMLDDEQARLTVPPEVRGRVVREGREVRLRGSIRTRAEVECDRCLKTIEVPVETEFDVAFIPSTDYERDETHELQAEDLSLSVFEGEEIDVDELVREQVLLALPSRVLCREDCKGLCPTCGVNRNTETCACEEADVDPRWSALKDFRF